MAGEMNEVVELLNCIRQFETDIKTENDEAENWRQCLIINEQKAKKCAKVKQKLQHALRSSEKELSQIREKARKAKKNFDYCEKQVAEYIAAIADAEQEQDEIEQEKKSLDKILANAEENILEGILKAKIEIYERAQQEKKRIDAKLELLDNGSQQEDLSTLCIATH